MATVAVPASPVNKVLFLALIVLLGIAPVAARGRVRIRTLSPLIIITIFLYGYGLSYINETDRDLTNQFVLSVSVLVLVYVIDWYQINFELLIKSAALFLCGCTALSVYIVVLARDSAMGALFMDLFLEYSLGSYGSRSFSDTGLFMFRIGTAPFLFLPFCLFFESLLANKRMRDFAALLAISAVIVVTTSRALILGCLIVSSYMVLIRLRPKTRVVAICLMAAMSLWLAQYLLAHTTIFSLEDAGNSGKIGHTLAFFEHMTLSRMLFGEGLASYYSTVGYNNYIPHTEVTLLDMARYVGMPLTAVLYAALLIPVLSKDAYGSQNRTHIFIFLMYVAISFTNPVLFNSFGLLIVVWYWSCILAGSDARAPALKDPKEQTA